MTDYSQMSDFEINKAVAIAVGFPCYYGDGSYSNGYGMRQAIVKGVNCYGSQMVGGFEPCNNPADAWPIILKNRIGIIPAPGDGQWKSAHRGIGDDGTPHHFSLHDNPLRAAMIVFLRMQESSNANP